MIDEEFEESRKRGLLIVKKLAAVGVNVEWISDLVDTKKSYPTAIEPLLDMIRGNEISDLGYREAIIRALTVKETRKHDITPLIEEYKKYTEPPPPYHPSDGLKFDEELRLIAEQRRKYPDDKSSYRWAIGNAIGYTMTKKDIPAVIELIKNKENWKSRNMMISEGLGKRLKANESEDILLALLDDFWVQGSAIIALGYIGSKKAVEKIQVFLDDKNPNLRKYAKKALERISKH